MRGALKGEALELAWKTWFQRKLESKKAREVGGIQETG